MLVLQCNKCTFLVGDVEYRGGYTCVETEYIWESSVPSCHFFCEFKTALKWMSKSNKIKERKYLSYSILVLDKNCHQLGSSLLGPTIGNYNGFAWQVHTTISHPCWFLEMFLFRGFFTFCSCLGHFQSLKRKKKKKRLPVH